MSEWTQLLDVLERQLARQERAFRASGELPNGLNLQQPDSVMTHAERVRATALMQRTDALLYETLDVMRQNRRPQTTPYG